MRRAHNARMKILLFLGGRSLPKPSPLAGCFLGGLRPPKLSRWGWLANPWAGVAHPNAITPVGAHTFCPPLNPARGGGQNLSLQYISGAGASQRQPHTPLSRSGRGGQGGEDQPAHPNAIPPVGAHTFCPPLNPDRGGGRGVGYAGPEGCAPKILHLRGGEGLERRGAGGVRTSSVSGVEAQHGCASTFTGRGHLFPHPPSDQQNPGETDTTARR